MQSQPSASVHPKGRKKTMLTWLHPCDKTSKKWRQRSDDDSVFKAQADFFTTARPDGLHGNHSSLRTGSASTVHGCPSARTGSASMRALPQGSSFSTHGTIATVTNHGTSFHMHGTSSTKLFHKHVCANQHGSFFCFLGVSTWRLLSHMLHDFINITPVLIRKMKRLYPTHFNPPVCRGGSSLHSFGEYRRTVSSLAWSDQEN